MIRSRKNVVIWIKSSQIETFSSGYHKGASYLALLDALSRRGHRVFLACDAAAYRDEGHFLPAAEYLDGALHGIEYPGEPVAADVVYNLGGIPTRDILRITNTPSFRAFCASKSAVYGSLKDLFPRTIRVSREEDLIPSTASLAGDRVVFKPDQGTNGRGVVIIKKAALSIDREMRAVIAELGGALVQEFWDTAKGIPGICDSYHDLRIAVMNGGAIALAHVRIPAAGSLIANHAQGAEVRELAVADVPPPILDLHRTVYAALSMRFPNPMYTMDAGIGPGGEARIFEINGTTAFPWPEFAERDLFIENLADHLERFF